MPPHNLLENPLAPTLNNIAMTRNNPIELPPTDSRHLPVESELVLRDAIPNHPPLPQRLPLRILQPVENLAQYARLRVDPGFAELFVGGEVEEQVAFD